MKLPILTSIAGGLLLLKRQKKLEKVSFSHFFDTLTGGMMPPANDF